MAHPYRRQRIARTVRDIVGEAMLHELSDPRIAPLTSVSRVEMTPDLLQAKVFLLIPGGEGMERRTLAALRHAGGFLQRKVAKALDTRQCPELRFEVDEQAKRVRHVLDLIETNRRERGDDSEAVDEPGGVGEISERSVESEEYLDPQQTRAMRRDEELP